MQIREIPLSANSFTGVSGTKYIIHDTLPVGRFELFEALQVEVLNNTSIAAFTGEIRDIWTDLQQVRVADATVKIYNIINGLERIQNKRPHPMLRMCTLFIAAENEGVQWSEALATEKLADWSDISQDFFLNCGLRFYRSYIQGFNMSTLPGSPEQTAGTQNDGADNEK